MKIVVVGGGTAGWITLSYLAATTDAELTIIYSNEIDTMGVGESTTPTVKHVADTIGVDERTWMKAGRATFKYGVEFLNFNKPGSRWHHTFDDFIPGQVFDTPFTEFGKTTFTKTTSSVEYFLQRRAHEPQKYNLDWFLRSQGGCEFLVENKLSPYNRNHTSNVNRFPGYSYHINAFEFGNCLRAHIPQHRYHEMVATIGDVDIDENGVRAVVLTDGTRVEGDVFVDCSGFKRLLIGKFSGFKKYQDLINNAAVWGPVHTQIDRPSTLSIAQQDGWIWETPTWGAVGSGFVYCNAFTSEQQAIDRMTQHWAKQGHKWEPFKSVQFESGRLENIAVKNVIANGLGQSFIEPLEATAIMVTCVTVQQMAELYNRHNGWNTRSSRILDSVLSKFLDDIKDFVKFHYTLSSREDTEYWRAYDKTNAVEEASAVLEKKLQRDWLASGETNYNGYNWASMVVGMDKPYTGNLTPVPCYRNYEFVSKQIQDNYEQIYRDNFSIKEYLDYIHN